MVPVLAAAGRVRSQHAPLAKAGRAGHVVGQDVGDEVGHALVQDTVCQGRGVLGPEYLAVGVLHAEHGDRLHGVAAVGKGSVGGRQLQQLHLAAAQRQRQAQPRRRSSKVVMPSRRARPVMASTPTVSSTLTAIRL